QMENTNKNDLTTGVVWKKLLRFFFPILAGLLFQQLYNTADAVIVGHYLGDEALASVGGSVSVITNLVIGFFMGLVSGATVMISQAYGAEDHERLKRVLHTGFLFCVAVGLLITLGGYFGAPLALRIVKTLDNLMGDSTLYLRIYLCGAVPMLTYNLLQGTLQAVGDSKRPFKYLICSCLSNIALDMLFIGAFGWGVAGAALASVISMCICTALALIHFLRTDRPHQFRFKYLKVDFSVLQNMLRIGLPSGLQSSMYSVSNIIIQAAINALNDTDLVAAWTATARLDGLYWVTTNAFGVAICAFVGQCYGAGKIERMKQAMKSCMGISLGVTAVLSCFLLLIARPAYSLFVRSDAAIDKAIEIMWCIVPFYFTWSYTEVLTGTLRGTGNTFVPMIIVLLGTCLFRVIWMYAVVPYWNNVVGISIVYVISWVITGVAFTFYYIRCQKNGFLNGRRGRI
ncbi:MAG: MATE family efflux transporter, partial [Clostridia bacterium]|nr:MATE family efflux transporter [Clostridia bacterium]